MSAIALTHNLAPVGKRDIAAIFAGKMVCANVSLTWEGRLYILVENIITKVKWRGKPTGNVGV